MLDIVSRRCLVAVLAETLPKTTQSKREFPPNLFFPWIPPHASPATYSPGMGPFLPTAWDSGLILIPPMV